MRCVLITHFGTPVEPEVNRNLAMVSGPTASCAASTAAVGRLAQSRRRRWCGGLAIGLRVSTTSTSAGTTASIARAKALPSAAKTRPGVIRSKIVRSRAKSLDTSE